MQLGETCVRGLDQEFCVIKWNDPGKKVLNSLTEIYLLLCTKAFMGNDSFKKPPVWRNYLHCSGVILAHSSTQTVFKSVIPYIFFYPGFFENNSIYYKYKSLYNMINVFTVTFDTFIASLLDQNMI